MVKNVALDTKTTVGKGVKTLGWVAGSGAIAYLIAFLTNNPDFFNPLVVGIINIALVEIKNYFDPKVKNI